MTSAGMVAPRDLPERGHEDEVDAILSQWREQRADLDPSPMGVFGRVSRVHTLSRARQTAVLERHGLNLAAFDVLANLRRSGPPFRKSPSELASSSMLTSGGVTFRLDKLESLGLIRRVPSREDRRGIHAELTDRGLEVIEAVIAGHLAVGDRMLARLTSEQRDELASLLAALERSVAAVPVAGSAAD